MNSTKKVAVVTGGNRGIGFETCRQLAQQGIQVILTSRDEAKGKAATEKLQAEELDVAFFPLNVTDTDSIDRLAQFIRDRFGKLDILVNNAGILLDPLGQPEESALHVKIDTIHETMQTNVYGPLMLCQALIPLMKERNYGRIVNVSSGIGQLSGMDAMSASYPGYRISKAGLNVITRMLANELRDTNILVNSVCPGWVQTDMGGPNALRTVEQGADTIVWLATLPDDGPTNGFFRDRQPIGW